MPIHSGAYVNLKQLASHRSRNDSENLGPLDLMQVTVQLDLGGWKQAMNRPEHSKLPVTFGQPECHLRSKQMYKHRYAYAYVYAHTSRT